MFWKLNCNEEQVISEDEAIRIVKDYPRDLSRIKSQTEQVCLEAVKEDCSSLQYVENQTKKFV